jgi:hypothetical protein
MKKPAAAPLDSGGRTGREDAGQTPRDYSPFLTLFLLNLSIGPIWDD